VRVASFGAPVRRNALATAIVMLAACAVRAEGPNSPTVERGRILMGTVCTARVESADTLAAAAAIARAFDRIAALEQVMSSWRRDSELSRFNARRESFECSPELFRVLAAARVWADSTGGAFDPTIEPLLSAWDIRGVGRVPSAAERDSARALVDWRSLELDASQRHARLARPGMAIDLGGIGKGAALDEAMDSLRTSGVRRALFDFGGQLAAIGTWDASVADPRDRARPLIRMRLEDASLSTSAQTENQRRVGGRSYGHVIDPRRGAPVEFLGSVSVRTASATEADALSTALLVMGREAAGAFAERHPEIGVLWLEPTRHGVDAWTWNLDEATAPTGARVTWKNRRTTSADLSHPSGRTP